MKNTSFSLNFVSTLTLVLISTLVLTACSPEQTAPSADEPAAIMETQPASDAQSGSTNQAATSELTPAVESSEPQTLTFSPRYISPGGEETLDILLVIADGVVTEGEAVSKAKHPTSKQMQAGFVEAFSGAVVGKTLAELESIDRIGGASLTTGGFRTAIAELNQS